MLVKDLGTGKARSNRSVIVDLNAIIDYFRDIPIALSVALDYTCMLSAEPLTRPQNQFSLLRVMEVVIFSAVMRIFCDAFGTDKVRLKLLKHILPIVIPVITRIFNKSI